MSEEHTCKTCEYERMSSPNEFCDSCGGPQDNWKIKSEILEDQRDEENSKLQAENQRLSQWIDYFGIKARLEKDDIFANQIEAIKQGEKVSDRITKKWAPEDSPLRKQKRAGAMTDKPKVICICGSTKFADLHAVMRWELEKQGAICLMINYLPQWYADKQGWNGNDHFGEQSGLKEHLDELHLRKIDMSDEVFVVNKNDYVGESTKREIVYAESQGKPVKYLEEHK